MALSAKHRSTIYKRLEPILGDQETEAMLLHFPSTDADEPVTRDFLRAELAELSAGLHAELVEQGAGLRADFSDTIHRQTVWLLGINITTMTMAVALARLVA